MFSRFWAIAHTSFVETIRQPIYGVILLATALLLVFNVSLAAFTLDDDDKLLLDLGLSTLLLSGLFLSAFSAAGILSREIENKTVLIVVSKPVSRPVFILGKYAGLIGALAVSFYISVLVFVLAQRHGVLQNTSDPWDAPVLTFGAAAVVLAILGGAFCNYFYGRHFPTMVVTLLVPLLTAAVFLSAKFDPRWNVVAFGSKFVGGQVLLASYFVFLMVMITAAIALAASTRFGQVLTLVTCLYFLGLGIASDYALGQHAADSAMAAFGYHIVPNFGVFWVVDGLAIGTEKTAVPGVYVLYMTAYAALIVAAVLGLAVAMFETREVG